MTTGNTPGDFENAYNALVNNSGINAISRQSANALVDRMLQAKESGKTAGITKRIAEAAAKGDTALIFTLTDELKDVKNTEQARNEKLQEVASGFTFTELLRAFPGDYRELVHELATLVLQATEEGLAKSKKRGSSSGARPFRDTGPTYIITHNGKQFEAKKNVGAAKSPGAEKDFYEFMGLEVSADGKTLDPATFVNSKGETVPTNSKKNIINDLLAGHKFWLDKGFRIREKPTQPA